MGWRTDKTATLLCVLAILGCVANRLEAAEQGQKIRVVIATGGHPFDRNNFFAMWNTFAGISWRETSQTKASEAFTPENLDRCDVLVLYDMMGDATDEQKAALSAFLKRGGGLVVLHHTICGRQQWSDFERIIGGKFLAKPEMRDGKELPKSAATGGVKFRVHVADPKHPVTQGLTDFDVDDEPYSAMVVNPKNHVLLTTDEPKSNKEVAWTLREGKARVVFIQLGHDNKTYANPNYRTIVERAVEWAAGRMSEGDKQK